MKPSTENVPVMQCIITAWSFFANNIKTCYAYGVPFILTAAIGSWISLFVDASSGLAGLAPILYIMSLIFFVMMQGATYRLALDLPKVGLGGLRLGDDEFRLLVVTVVVFLIAAFVAMVVAILLMFLISPILSSGIDPALLEESPELIFSQSGGKVWLMLGLAAVFIWLVMFYLFARFAPAFPAAIAEKNIFIFEAAAWTKGQGLRIAFASLIAFAPIYVLLAPELIMRISVMPDIMAASSNGENVSAFSSEITAKLRSGFHWQILSILLAPALNAVRVGLFTTFLRGLRPSS
ncbi:MAG: hypothetical protein COA60_001415 [Robiginitomaculum sp.]|nr:hypothetical protein [Robiginitomaculum sp.]